MKKEIPESKYVRFIVCKCGFFDKNIPGFEERFEQVGWMHSRTLVLVLRKELENYKNDNFRFSIFGVTSVITSRISNEELFRNHQKYKLNIGEYFSLESLVFEDDFIEYANGRMSLSEIRCASDFIPA